MAILLTGGTGKTSIPLASFLRDAAIPFLLASRRAEDEAPFGMAATKFDWLEPSTFEIPFQHKSLGEGRISAVYLVAPGVPDPVPSMNAFIDHAVSKHGVKRFVLLAGTSTEKGGHHVGKVWQHLVDIGVEYCVLRPTWFMGAYNLTLRTLLECLPADGKRVENFTEQQHRGTIKEEGKIYTACGDGKIPFISATDIAAVAFRALVDEKPHNTDHTILGPELLTHDEIAAKLSSGLSHNVVHVKLSEEQAVQRYMNLGLPEFYAKFLASLEVASANGAEERMNNASEEVTGRPPQKFDAWVQQNKRAWQ